MIWAHCRANCQKGLSMIEIGHLRLQLPAGFEQRGSRIAQLVGQALVQQAIPGNRQIQQLQIGPLKVDPNQSNTTVARTIAHAIGRQLTGGEK
jgi:hypothetical protein